MSITSRKGAAGAGAASPQTESAACGSETGKTAPANPPERPPRILSPAFVARMFVGCLSLGCIALGVIYGRKYFSFTYLAENHRRLGDWVDSQFFEAATMYVLAMSILIGLTMPGATLLSFAGGVLFPQPYAALFAYTGYVVGAIISFSLVSFVLADFCKKRLEPYARYQKFQRNVKKNALLYLILARYTFVFPFWFVNTCSAVLEVSFPTFVVATNLSVIPGSIVYTSAGRSLGNLLKTAALDKAIMDGEGVKTSELLWSALQDPNVRWCLGGVTLCLIFAVAASRAASGGEEEDEAKAVKKTK